MKRLAIVVCLVLAGLAAGNRAPAAVHAATLTVCQTGSCTYSSIQAAINAATPGSTILVQPGCYFENLSIEGFENPGITIQSTNGPGPHTTAAPPNFTGLSDPCFVSNTTSAGTYIDGMCDGSSTVYIYDSQVTIAGFTIQDGCLFDSFYDGGAGVWNDEFSSTTLSQDWVFVNDAECCQGIAGGVFNYYDSAIQLYGTQVVDNFNDNFGAAGVLNYSEGYVDPPAGAPSHSSVRPSATATPNRGGALAGASKLQQGLHRPATAQGGGAHSRRQNRPQAAAPLTAAGSSTPGTGLTAQKATIQYNASEYGPAGMSNYGTATLAGTNVATNYGGCVGGVNGGDNTDGVAQTTLNLSAIQGNVAAYYSYCDNDSEAFYFVASGAATEMLFNLTTTPVKNNSYAYNPGRAASGLFLDHFDDQTPYEKFVRSSSPVTGNTPPPQCASGGSLPSPC